MSKFNTIKLSNKFKYLLVLIGIVFAVTLSIPTLSRYKNRTSYYQVIEWDGSIASEYRSGSGTLEDPYIISNGQEFAFFIEKLKTTDYDGYYFKLNNDIILNKGRFSYDGKNITYTKEEKTYNLNSYKVNKIDMVNTFSGNLDGNSFRIYGLYVNSQEDEVSLFKNLNGNISNLYVENSIINGGYVSSGLAINSNSAYIKNVLYDGYVIGNANNKISTYDLADIISTENGIIDLSQVDVSENIISATLSGTYVKDGNITQLSINGNVINEGEFSLELDNTIEDLEYIIEGDGSIELTNLKYSIISDYNVSSGFIINANNTKFENVASYVDVYSNNYTSGLVYNSQDSITIKNTYNKGSLNGNIASGLINELTGIANIDNSYNSGLLNSQESYSFINKVNDDSQVTITNSFATSGTYGINSVSENSTININNSYITHENSINTTTSSSKFIKANESDFKNSTFIKTDLGFSEYNSNQEQNNDNVWLINDGQYPILYIDDLNNTLAKINVSMFSWNNLSNDLNKLNFSNRFVFNITSGSEVSNIKKIYYYLHNSDTTLTEEQLQSVEWIEYFDIVEVNTKGNYIIYAKVIDNNDNITYINSDILSINLNESIISAVISNKEYNTYNVSSEYLYINESSKVSVNINEEYTKLSKVSYYISEENLEISDLEELESSSWKKYEEFSFDSQIPKKIYFRVKDNTDYYSYINTDYIVLNGYNQSELTVGRNIISGNNLNITSDSSIKFNTSFKNTFNFIEGYKHVLVSNSKLPENSTITLIDNKTNKVFTYKLTNEDYGFLANNLSTYNLSNFIEVGKGENEMYFNDNNYIGEIDEDFTIIINFKDIEDINNYENINLYMSILDSDNNTIISTIKDNIKLFNVYSLYDENEVNAQVVLNSSYNKTINYNQDYLNIIPYEITLDYFSKNGNIVYDSSFEDMKYGLEISLYNKTTSTTMNKKFLNNVNFIVDDVSYHPNSNGVVNINLNSNNIGNLNIETYTDNFEIDDGEYVFKICPYTSLDGVNYNESKIDGCKEIPLIMEFEEIKEYNFDVLMNNESKVLNKNGIQALDFNILQMSELENPNIRVSLYEKKEPSAYDQSYNRVNIIDYISGEYELFSESTAYVLKDALYSSDYYQYELLIDTDKLNLNGYKLIFELYDNEELITTIEQKFIVRKGRGT